MAVRLLRACREPGCSAGFQPTMPEQLFCCLACETRFHQREARRNAAVRQAFRLFRQRGQRGEGLTELSRLVAQFNAEDRDLAAGATAERRFA